MSIEAQLSRARKLFTIATVPSYRAAARHGVVASAEHHRSAFPGDFRTVIDIGANRGQFALVARERWPHANLICFEPLPEARARLREIVGDDVAIVGAAAGATSGVSQLHISRANDSSSLLPITATQSTTFPGTEEVASTQVEVVRVDEEVKNLVPPALLKIDVQGFELEVLRGAEGLLASIDLVLVECSFREFYGGQAAADEVIRFLHGYGFALTAATSPITDRNGEILQLDLKFERPPLDGP